MGSAPPASTRTSPVTACSCSHHTRSPSIVRVPGVNVENITKSCWLVYSAALRDSIRPPNFLCSVNQPPVTFPTSDRKS